MKGSEECSRQIISAWNRRKGEIEARLEDIRQTSIADPLATLQYCVLTPQQPMERAMAASAELGHRVLSVSQTAAVLRRHGIRFHNQKAQRFVAANTKGEELQGAFARLTHDKDCRRWIKDNFSGIGMKEATHVLRNMGRAERMAMLDSWVIGKLLECEVIKENPKNLSYPTNYERIERIYVEWADSMRIPPRHLDLETVI